MEGQGDFLAKVQRTPMVSQPLPNVSGLSTKPSAPDVPYRWEPRYRHALDNAKRCRRLARYIATDEHLSLGLEQLAADYEDVATWLRRL